MTTAKKGAHIVPHPTEYPRANILGLNVSADSCRLITCVLLCITSSNEYLQPYTIFGNLTYNIICRETSYVLISGCQASSSHAKVVARPCFSVLSSNLRSNLRVVPQAVYRRGGLPVRHLCYRRSIFRSWSYKDLSALWPHTRSLASYLTSSSSLRAWRFERPGYISAQQRRSPLAIAAN